MQKVFDFVFLSIRKFQLSNVTNIDRLSKLANLDSTGVEAEYRQIIYQTFFFLSFIHYSLLQKTVIDYSTCTLMLLFIADLQDPNIHYSFRLLTRCLLFIIHLPLPQYTQFTRNTINASLLNHAEMNRNEKHFNVGGR